jgi:hypothetical protein
MKIRGVTMSNEENSKKSKKVILMYINLILLITLSIGWFGFILPFMVSYNSDLLVISGIMVTLIVVIPWIVVSCIKLFNKFNERTLK